MRMAGVTHIPVVVQHVARPLSSSTKCSVFAISLR
jgi:hypothetical protein